MTKLLKHFYKKSWANVSECFYKLSSIRWLLKAKQDLFISCKKRVMWGIEIHEPKPWLIFNVSRSICSVFVQHFSWVSALTRWTVAPIFSDKPRIMCTQHSANSAKTKTKTMTETKIKTMTETKTTTLWISSTQRSAKRQEVERRGT